MKAKTRKRILKEELPPSFRCAYCRKLVVYDNIVVATDSRRPKPTHCDDCIQNLERELDKLRRDTINDIESLDSWELIIIADDIRMVFEDILKQYRVKDSMQLEEILNS